MRPPNEVLVLWRCIAAAAKCSLSDLGAQERVVSALLHLVALADAASAGVGLSTGPKGPDAYQDRSRLLLAGIGANGASTLSPLLAPTEVRVLPKQHAPRGGLTLRSLTHHLALHIGGEVTPFWDNVPQARRSESLNLLIAPWPLTLQPSQFQVAAGALDNMPDHFGFVDFRLKENPALVSEWVQSLLDQAVEVGGRVDGVVFPEASLTMAEYQQVVSVVLARGCFLIAGVLSTSVGAATSSNQVMFDATEAGQRIHTAQHKHHRWRLDRSQIEMYGLGGTLDPARDWWEHIAVPAREVHFVTFNDQLSMCCLICEDLARQDPVAELVRSV
ncbi:MAG: hypothetical protein HOO96_00675, partial [Polyangiaceae bacterium]|nr:hypothetical protein [Polyangiaceae bacterium]